MEDKYDWIVKHKKINSNGCWISHYSNNTNYITVRFKKKNIQLHRLSYMIANGIDKLPEKLEVHHICGESLCFNPEHLELITKKANIGEMRLRVYFEHEIERLEALVADLEASNAQLKYSLDSVECWCHKPLDGV